MYERIITIDIDRPYTNRIPSVQCDSGRKVKVKLKNQGRPLDLTDTRVVLACVKPDGHEIFNDTEVVDKTKGEVLFSLTEQINAEVGQVRSVLKLYDGDTLVTSKEFFISVDASVGTSVASSSNELNALTKAINEVQNIDNRFSKTHAEIDKKMDAGGEITVSQINKNKGKLDQTYMSEEFLQQMAGTTPINTVPAQESVVTSMLAPSSITDEKLDNSALKYASEYFTSLAKLDTENCGVDFITSNLVIENDSGVISAGGYGSYHFKWYKGFQRGAKFSIKIPNVVVPEGAEIIARYRTANMSSYGPVKHKLKIIGDCAIITDLMFTEDEAYGVEVLFDNRKGATEMYFTKPEMYSGPLPINTYSMKANDIQEMLNKTNYIVGGNGNMTLVEMNEQKHPNCVELKVGDVSVIDEKFVIGNDVDKGYLFFLYEATGEFEPGKTISFLADVVEPCDESKVEIKFVNASGSQIGSVRSAQVVNNRYVLESLFIPADTAQINIRIDNRGTSKDLVLANLRFFAGDTNYIELPKNTVNFNNGSVKLNFYPDPDCKTNKYFNYTSASTVKTEVVPNGLKLSNLSTTSFQACGYEFENSTTESLLLSVEIGEVSDNMSASDAILVVFFKDGVELSRKKVTISQSKIYIINTEVPEGTNSVRLRFDIGVENYYVVSRINLSMEETKLTDLVSHSQVINMIAEGGTSGTYYVSPTGSDENDGSSKQPLATVDKALEKGANSIYLYGGVYEQTINLKKCVHKTLSISRFEIDKEVTFIDADRVLCDEETSVSGYTKVYKAEVNKTLSSANIWIFQDSIPDESTLISDEERHPLQRGYEYRCPDTKIQKCTSTTLNEALREIEESNEYKWYTENSVLYFSRPSNVNSDNPICCSNGRTLFTSPAGIELKVSGISTKYLAFNINSTLNSEIADCKATNVYGAGAFVYNSALNCKFIRCEASRCYNGSKGDGFNGHCSNTGDIHSKQLTATFIDCWSHDNNDDGYSDHERAESTFIGGLFEYNKKGGVTPSYGAHITCYNVLSRHNYCGFNYVGTVVEAEGGKYGQMICYNCVAENNTHGGEKAGFNVNGTKNTIKLINCKSLNHQTGYKASNSTNTVEMIDCSSYQDDATKGGSGTFIIKNTTVVV